MAVYFNLQSIGVFESFKTACNTQLLLVYLEESYGLY